MRKILTKRFDPEKAVALCCLGSIQRIARNLGRPYCHDDRGDETDPREGASRTSLLARWFFDFLTADNLAFNLDLCRAFEFSSASCIRGNGSGSSWLGLP